MKFRYCSKSTCIQSTVIQAEDVQYTNNETKHLLLKMYDIHYTNNETKHVILRKRKEKKCSIRFQQFLHHFNRSIIKMLHALKIHIMHILYGDKYTKLIHLPFSIIN